MIQTVSVGFVQKGDKILVYSRKRVMPREARVKEVHRLSDVIVLDTTAGRVTVHPQAVLDVP